MRVYGFNIFGLLFLSLFGLPAVAETPAVNEGVCNDLMGSTPGLYGLCVAFCEAQDCEVTYDPATQDVTFDADCRPSSPKLLDNFNKRAGPGGPTMPCINIVENECPCWTEMELDAIADKQTDDCFVNDINGQLVGSNSDDIPEGVNVGTTGPESHLCVYDSTSAAPESERIVRFLLITPDEFSTCSSSIATECTSRGFTQ